MTHAPSSRVTPSVASRPPPACREGRAPRGLVRTRGLVPAVLASAVALSLVVWRVAWWQRATFVYLPWNLALAWVPYLASLAADVAERRARGLVLPLGALWLLFLPNAPYLLTDFVHLRPRPGVPVWFDIALLAANAAAGWLLGLLSLDTWRARWAARWGRAASWLGVALVSALCGYGVYLGRVPRWNSWDVWRAPGVLLEDVVSHLAAPAAHPGLVLITALFAALMLASTVAFAGLRSRAGR